MKFVICQWVTLQTTSVKSNTINGKPSGAHKYVQTICGRKLAIASELLLGAEFLKGVEGKLSVI